MLGGGGRLLSFREEGLESAEAGGSLAASSPTHKRTNTTNPPTHQPTDPTQPTQPPRSKTTFIKSLLGRDYPGAHIGPEPTTDRFVVVHHGLEERRTPGNTLAVQPDKPYQGLSGFGTGACFFCVFVSCLSLRLSVVWRLFVLHVFCSVCVSVCCVCACAVSLTRRRSSPPAAPTGFLTRFEGSQCAAPLLEDVSIVDTPGVLSGEKQRIGARRARDGSGWGLGWGRARERPRRSQNNAAAARADPTTSKRTNPLPRPTTSPPTHTTPPASPHDPRRHRQQRPHRAPVLVHRRLRVVRGALRHDPAAVSARADGWRAERL